jgi:hypothetical protein
MGKAAENRRKRNNDRRDDQQNVERRKETYCEEVANFPDHCSRLRRTFESILNPIHESRRYPDRSGIAALSTLQLAVKSLESAIAASFDSGCCPCRDHL